MGRIPYQKGTPVHWHRKGTALTACGRSWREFWDADEPIENWNKGSLPYGESTATDTKVTCQQCLEGRYNQLKRELEVMEERIDVFWGPHGKKLPGQNRARASRKGAGARETKPRISPSELARRISRHVVAECTRAERENRRGPQGD